MSILQLSLFDDNKINTKAPTSEGTISGLPKISFISSYKIRTKTDEILDIISTCHSSRVYFHPFPLNSNYSNAIIDETITYEQFTTCEDNYLCQEYEGQRHRYTEIEMQSTWNMILFQRQVLSDLLYRLSNSHPNIP